MRITHLDVSVIGDGPDVDPDKGGVEPLAIIAVHTDAGISGLSEVFRVPPGVVRATVGGKDSHFGRLLLGREITAPRATLATHVGRADPHESPWLGGDDPRRARHRDLGSVRTVARPSV
ncbi:MAG: hypothetical protein U0992_22765 [Planctomycetaceae bacterium]